MTTLLEFMNKDNGPPLRKTRTSVKTTQPSTMYGTNNRPTIKKLAFADYSPDRYTESNGKVISP